MHDECRLAELYVGCLLDMCVWLYAVLQVAELDFFAYTRCYDVLL
jgi:hypothetical protein